MDMTLVFEIVIATVLLIALGYFVSLILHKRVYDNLTTQLGAATTAMITTLQQYAYYGLYERSEILRTIANVVGIDILKDTVATIEHYPPPPPQPPAVQYAHVTTRPGQ